MISDNPKVTEPLLAKYGKAVSICNLVETIVFEVTKQNGNLVNVNKEILDFLYDSTFGTKISLLKKVIKDEALFKKLDDLNLKRNILAHGLSLEKDEQLHLIHKRKEYKLNEIVELGISICNDLLNRLKQKHISL